MILDLSSKISRDFLDILPPSQALTRQLSQRESLMHYPQVIVTTVPFWTLEPAASLWLCTVPALSPAT